MNPADWMLTAQERGNPDTTIDRRHDDGTAWTAGNHVTPLPHGDTYFSELLTAVRDAEAGDTIMFTDWRGDPDESLDDKGSTVSTLLCEAAARGVLVKGLVWRSHLDVLLFSAAANRRLGAEVEEAGGECLLDMRVRPGGSHHQKMFVVRYRGHPQDDVAFVGGIDLCYSRRDDADHLGDNQPQQMSDRYGDRPPWHDVQLAIRGPAVGDVELSFRERWDDPSRLTHNPVRIVGGWLHRDDPKADPMPPQPPDPAPRGTHIVQVLRTYPRRYRAYPFARQGERSIARAYTKVLRRARSLIYLEDQYLWSGEVAEIFAEALGRAPDLKLIAVVPLYPDTQGFVGEGEVLGRQYAMQLLQEAGGDRVAVYGLENRLGTPVYVHAKVCVVDDVWSCVGSDNLNLRSWTHDSEMACAVVDADGGTSFGRALRLALNREHLDRDEGDDRDLHDADGLFTAYRNCAQALERWYASTTAAPRPPGRLRPCATRELSWPVRWLARPVYGLICDPDGRPRRLRRQHRF